MKQTRVLILSDTHGFVDPRILALAGECDAIVHAGDIGNAGVLSTLATAGTELIAVRGNNDTMRTWPRSERAVLKALPSEQALELPHGYVVVVHGDRFLPASRRHERLRRHYPGTGDYLRPQPHPGL